MTFWYVFIGTDLIFSNFYLYFHLGLITTPHVLYVHMTYVSFFARSHGQEKSLSYYDLLYDFRSSTLRTHPHPHFPLLPPQTHHPYTPRLCRTTTAPLGEGFHPVTKYGHPAILDCTLEDSRHSRLSTAKVEWVLPSRKSAPRDGRCYREPSPD